MAKHNDEEVGKLLRQHRLREPRNTLEDVANAAVGLGLSAISNYEQGIRRLKPREAKILSAAFEKLGKPISAAALLQLEDHATAGQVHDPVADHDDSFRRLARLVEIWPQLSERMQASLLERAENEIKITPRKKFRTRIAERAAGRIPIRSS